MKLRKKVNLSLLLVYLFFFIINSVFVVYTIVRLKNSYIDFYEQEIKLILNMAEEQNSRFFSGYLKDIMNPESSSPENLVNWIKDQEYSDDLFLYSHSEGFVLGLDLYKDILTSSDFEAAAAAYRSNGRLTFIKNNVGVKSDIAPYSITYRYFPDRKIFIGYGTFYDQFKNSFNRSIKFFADSNKGFGIISLVMQIAGIALIITLTMRVVRREFLDPIHILNNLFIKIGKGDFDFQVPSFKGKELNSIAYHLKKMADQLQQIIVNLEKEVKKVEEREVLYRILIENLPQKIFLKNNSSVFVSCNTAFARDVDIKPEEIKNKTDYDLYSTEEAARYRQEDAEILLSQEALEMELVMNHGGNKRWVHLVKVPVIINSDKPDYILGIFWDITDRKKADQEIRDLNAVLEKRVIERTRELLVVNKALEKANERLEELTLIDPLTELPNRRSLEKELHQEWRISLRDKTPVSILMIDVDYFKLYNDNYGHQAGDNCLQIIAQCLESNITRPRDFCARYGGEEFIIILGQTPVEGAVKIAESIRDSVDKASILHEYSKAGQVITVSIGVATMIPVKKSEAKDLVSQSDKALYLAKKNGRNRVEVYT